MDELSRELSANLDRAVSSFNRTWALQGVVGALAVVYIISPDLTKDFVAGYGIGLSLFQVGMPILSLYLSGNVGYTLSHYISLRRKLVTRIGSRQTGTERRLWILASQSASLLQIFANITDRRESFDLSLVNKVVLVSVALVVASVITVSNGTSIYLLYRSLDGAPPVIARGLGIGGLSLLISSLYWQCYSAMRKEIGRWAWGIGLLWSFVGLTLTLWLLADPLP